MPSVVVLYPAYGAVSCHQISRYAEEIEGLRLVLADDEPTTSDEDIFDEVMELPPPQRLGEAHDLMRRWCDRLRPDGIFMQSERGLLLGSLLAHEFGLKGPSIEAAHLCSNKYLQRVKLSHAGIGNPQFALGETASDVRRLGRDYGYPLLLKCVISTMARLVTPVNDEDGIESAVARITDGLRQSLDVARLLEFAETAKVDLGCDPRRQFLVESFLNGDYVETDGLVIGGKPFTFGVTEQIQSVDPLFFIEGYLLPAECSESAPIEKVSNAIIKAVGLKHSGFSIELRFCENVVRVVEVNGRLGWDEGLDELFGVRTHGERILQALQLSLGLDPKRTRDESRFAAVAYRSCYFDGIVEELPTKEELEKLGRDGLVFGLATHKGARFVKPPSPDTYPHVVWALCVDPESSHVAFQKARQAVDRLNVSIRRI